MALILGAFLPYSFVSYRRQKRFEKIEELFPEAIDTVARAVRAGHAFTTALEMISNEVSEPLATEFRKLIEEARSSASPVRDALRSHQTRPLVRHKIFCHGGDAAARNRRKPGRDSRQLVVCDPASASDSAPGGFTLRRAASPLIMLMLVPRSGDIIWLFSLDFVSPAFNLVIGLAFARGQHRIADHRIFCDPQDH